MPRYELGPQVSVTFASPVQDALTAPPGALTDVQVSLVGAPSDGGYTHVVAIPPFDPTREQAPSRLHAVAAPAPVPDGAAAHWFMDPDKRFPIASEPAGQPRDPVAGTQVTLSLQGADLSGQLVQVQIIREFPD
jgi:hypothetical protein